MESNYDVIIVGGGMVGATLACLLGDSSYKIAVLEHQEPKPFSPEQAHDLRVSALSLASENILQYINAWQGIESRRLCPYRRMRVWEEDAQRAATEFDSTHINQPYLGHIVENRIVQLALLERLPTFSNIDFICPANVEKIFYTADASRVTLADGREYNGRLVIGADGANSRVRQAAGIGVHSWDYPQRALIASVKTAYPQQDITWQQFTPTGPLAFLPLSGDCASLVWYHRPDEVQRLQALPQTQFMAELTATFPPCLGDITALEQRGSFPLRRQHAQQYVAEGVALIGDAAHTIHPLAGQGVNIGLLDAAALGEVLLNAQKSKTQFASLAVLKTYEAKRRRHNLLMMQTMDAFYRVFSNDFLPLKIARNLGLGAAARLPFARDQVMQFAMGLKGNLPEFIRM